MMRKGYLSRSHQMLSLLLVGLLIPVSACSEQKPPSPKLVPGTTQTEPPPFYITLDPTGKPMVMDVNGAMIEPTRLEWPVKTTQVYGVHTMSIVHMEGSDFYVVTLNGVNYLIHRRH